MKVKELIKQLEECDPEAVVGWEPIWFAEQLEPYWDGYVAEVIRKKGEPPIWKYNTEHPKVVLHLWDIEEFIETFFRKEDGVYKIPTFEEIMKHVKNIPKNINGVEYPRYKKRWKRKYENVKETIIGVNKWKEEKNKETKKND